MSPKIVSLSAPMVSIAVPFESPSRTPSIEPFRPKHRNYNGDYKYVYLAHETVVQFGTEPMLDLVF